MKKGIILVILILIGMVIYANAGTGRTYGYEVITTTGVTAIQFDYITKEIGAVVYSTNTCYFHATSSYTMTASNATNYFLLQRRAITAEPDKHVEEVESSRMSVFTLTPPVNIRVWWKMWR